MEKQEFIKKLRVMNVKCIILDDYLINPNEIIVFTDAKKKLFHKMKTNDIFWSVMDGEKKRYIRIFSYKDMGIEHWQKDLWNNGEKISETLVLMNKEDRCAVFLYYAFTYVEIKHWLYHNILHKMQQELGVSDLADWLASYMRQRRYDVTVRKIVDLPETLNLLLSPLQRYQMLIGQVYLKIVRRLRLLRLGKICRRYYVSTYDRYIENLKSSSMLDKEWVQLNKKVGGSSGCILIKTVYKGELSFIKGNEVPICQSVKNEIFIQKILREKAEDVTWFLPMKDYDISQGWIRYEYMTLSLLSQYIEKNKLTEDSLELLGEYLIDVLDKLYTINIVHNDLRAENIMVRMEGDKPIGFILFDFGCSSYEGSCLWSLETFWGNFYARGVCGDMRYNEVMVDDAASALLIYLNAGGNVEDKIAQRIRERIGRKYFAINEW